MKHQKAFSLIELLLVLVVISIVSFLGVNSYRNYQQARETTAIQSNLTSIFYALNIYYRKHCRNNTQFNVSFEDISPTFKLENTDIVTSYQVQANLSGHTIIGNRPIYRFIVHVFLKSNTPTDVVDWYAKRLGATEKMGTTLTWLSMPSYTRPQTDTKLWLARPDLRNFKLYFSDPASDSCGY